MDLKDMLRQLDEDLLAEILEAAHCALNRPGAAKRAVSYTHLTLPTNREV